MDKRLFSKVAELLSEANTICVLTGAGISAESGIKTFRDAGGLWEGHPIEKVATPEGFAEDPIRVWEFYNERRKAAHRVTPNPAHRALARLDNRRAKKELKPISILTQNIDGLHQQAGSLHVVELHGSLWKVRCTGCQMISRDHPIELPLLPKCQDCGSLLRPHVVWFGENLESEVLETAEWVSDSCDLFLVIGTSAVVQPAASYPFFAARRGIPIIEINKEKTPVSVIAAYSLEGLAGEILPKIIPD